MLRFGTLSAKQDALDSSIRRRDSILRELFRATLAFRKTKSRDTLNHSEDAFLDANNLSEGRYFDHATLPSLPSFLDVTYTKSPSIGLVLDGAQRDQDTFDDPKKPYRSSIEREVGPLAREKTPAEPATATVGSPGKTTPAIPEEIRNKLVSPAGSEEKEYGRPGSALDTLGSVAVSVNSDLAIRDEAPILGQEPQIPERETGRSPTKLPLSSDGVGALPQSTSQTIPPKQNLDTVGVVHLPNEDIQGEYTQPGPQSLQDPQAISDEALEKKIPPNDTQKPAPATTSDDGLAKHNVPEAQPSARAHPEINKPSQVDTVRSDAIFVGTPATPDEQLRLEQAQALQLSQISSTVSEGDEARPRGPTSMPDRLDMEPVGLHKFDYQLGDSTASLIAMEERQDDKAKNQFFESETAGLREHTIPGMNRGLSKDLTFSRRPPMRIDTGGPPKSDAIKSPQPNQRTTTPGATPFTPAESATASKSGPATSQVNVPPERMTTRVSSGALRHKSVSEILGEAPKYSNLPGDKAVSDKAVNESAREIALQSPRSTASISSPDSAAFKQRLNELKERERSKLSTVVFARQQHTHVQRYGDLSATQHDEIYEEQAKPKDYLLPLFVAQASKPPISQSLHSLVGSAHKTLSTADQYTDFQDQQDCWILTKIYQLQSANRWSLRQNERSVEATRPKAHWDVLLNHTKWMRTDFREERKWKLAAAKSLADACAHWVASPLEVRNLVQVKVKSKQHQQGSNGSTVVQTPELIPSADDDSEATDFETSDIESTKRGAPGSIFSLPPDMFVFGLERTPVAEKILSELPLYRPSTRVQDAPLNRTTDVAGEDWRAPVVPFSKYVEGKLITHQLEPPRKKSRYDYSSDRGSPRPHARQPSQGLEPDVDGLGPEQDDVALFRPENKHIRDRIHAGHAFRPPSEYQMPSQSFFESRQSSQWTQGEDDDLRRLVREYAYNWSLISSCLSSSSRFSSGAERRTPWECFERWIGLEGLPAEMSKTQYFKEYHARLQAAQRNYEAHQQALQQQHNNNAQVPVRRRTTMPFLVERRKNNKHLHLVDAMRKLAKKRETAMHKQQHVAGLAAMRKQNEAVQTKTPMHTPQEFSRVKYEREQKMQENARLYHQQFVQQQREKAKSQRSGGPSNGQSMMPLGSGYPPSANGSSPTAAPAIPNGPGQAGPVGPMRSMPSITRLPNGTQVPSTLPVSTHGVPHAPMQPQISMQQRISAQMIPDNARMLQEANRLQEQQRRYLAAQTQHQHPHPQSNGQLGNPSSPPNIGHLNTLSHQSNASLYGGLQGRAGSPSMNGGAGATGSQSSTGMNNPTQPQPLSSGMVPVVNQVQNQIKARHPQASPEQINTMTNESLHQYRMSQAAMQAAAGNPNATGIPNHNSLNGLASQSQQQAMMNGVSGSPMMTPNAAQQYAALIRSQQAQQSRNASAGGMSAPRTASRSVTPGHAPSQSPRPSQAQMAGGQ